MSDGRWHRTSEPCRPVPPLLCSTEPVRKFIKKLSLMYVFDKLKVRRHSHHHTHPPAVAGWCGGVAASGVWWCEW